MLKLALVAAALTAAGTTAYVVHARTTGSSPAPAPAMAAVDSPHAKIAAPAQPAIANTPAPAPGVRPLPTMPGPGKMNPVDKVVPRDQLAKLTLDKGPSRGPIDAPVTVVVFQDNMCTYCGNALATLDELLEVYPGKLRIVLKQFPVHASARLSAEALYAADAQGKFWELHDIVFQHQDDLSRDALISYAQQVQGLDIGAFTTALDHHTFAKAVAADEAAGKEVGVQGTPSFLINGRLVVGALPVEMFRQVIDQALQD